MVLSDAPQTFKGARTFRPRTFRPGHFGHGHFGQWTFRPRTFRPWKKYILFASADGIQPFTILQDSYVRSLQSNIIENIRKRKSFYLALY